MTKNLRIEIVIKSNNNFNKSLTIVNCQNSKDESSPPELFLGKGVLKICSKFTG